MMLKTLRLICLIVLLTTSLAMAKDATPKAHKKPAAAAPAAKAAPLIQPAPRIVARVNGDIITMKDVFDRYRVFLASTKQNDKAELRAEIFPKIVRSLIDEKLQVQAARAENITVTKEELQSARQKIAADNKVSEDKLDDLLRSQKVPVASLMKQIDSGISWGKYIGRRLRQDEDTADLEAAEAIDVMQTWQGEIEKRVFELFFAREDNQIGVPQEIKDQLDVIRKDPKKFEALAHQNSQNASAVLGGEVGWVRDDSMGREALDQAIKSLSNNQISDIQESDEGYHIFYVTGSRAVGSDLPPEDDKKLETLTVQLRKERLQHLALNELNKMRRAARIELFVQ